MTAELVVKLTDEQAKPGQATTLFKQMMTSADFQEFLTLGAYDYID